MSADSGYGISNASGFATISLVIVTLLLLGVLTLMTVDVMQAELQVGYSEQAFRQAEIDAESRMALAMAQLARQGQTVPESQTLADGVLWWKGYPASDGSPLVTLVAQGRSPTGDARARIRQQFSWLALYPELPPTAVLAPFVGAFADAVPKGRGPHWHHQHHLTPQSASLWRLSRKLRSFHRPPCSTIWTDFLSRRGSKVRAFSGWKIRPAKYDRGVRM